MKCPECGAINPSDAAFCKNCGVKFVNNTYNVKIEEPQYSENTSSSSNSNDGAGSIIACCCIAGALLFILGMFL